jgi:lipid A 3-O-deacylase
MRLTAPLASVLVVGALATIVGSARAADIAAVQPTAVQPTTYGFLSEARVGVFAHDSWSPESGSVDINAELLSVKPFTAAGTWDWAVPRFHMGASVNTQGRTSNAYAGLSWTANVTSAIFLEASLGGAVNNGATGAVIPVDRNAVGCHASFRESASVGFRMTEQVSIMGTVEHYSNAGLCERNRGVTNLGVRLGYSF